MTSHLHARRSRPTRVPRATGILKVAPPETTTSRKSAREPEKNRASVYLLQVGASNRREGPISRTAGGRGPGTQRDRPAAEQTGRRDAPVRHGPTGARSII